MIDAEYLIKLTQCCDIGACSYIDGQEECIRAVRCIGLSNEIHAELISRGYRHSGDLFYTPACHECRRCLSMRINPERFKPSKKQRHIININKDISVHIGKPVYTDEKFEVYSRYMQYQHCSSRQGNTKDDFKCFLYTIFDSSVEIIYKIGDEIAGVTLTDTIPKTCMSSIYHYFNPDFAKRSIGVFSILHEIKLCQNMAIPYYYLGYLVRECRKMKYKAQYRPYELLIDGRWQEIEDDEKV